MNIIIGLIGIATGFMMTWKSEWLLENFGRIDWAEEKLSGYGGTRIFWKLFGLGVIIFSMMHMFGLWQATAMAILSPIFSGFSG